MEFEWDDEKSELNRRKHGIGFDEAVKAFDDRNGLEILDEQHSHSEIRYQLIAMADGNVLMIVFTERISAIRIISARRATRPEVELYYGRQS
jgi:uncharacterized protein